MSQRPNVILRGGPSVPDTERVLYVPDPTQRLKIFRGHRYEHFEPTPETALHAGRKLLVFTWSGCTYVAE
ncbi:DUF5988 family protein [Streptomyces sedi]|uniref:Uncharacterized protein n=1 Tax=Streptomyces sedi TaxID=555059 RepID=A0A5C4V1N1_9ACTN|nr:DUF5988 family protein [Streptomyces sedi]TNM29842.1 hypothetical protein FH715_13965 [Streptomyces sedi]